MRQLFWWSIFAALAAFALAEEEVVKKPKLISPFQVVRFNNDPCVGTSNMNGTCYLPEECEARSGTNSGSCAEGYGVCCTFTKGCGGVCNENITYFNTQQVSGSCNVKICPMDNNICKLRLDLDTFIITGPSTITSSQITALNGEIINTGTKKVGFNGVCQSDIFSVTGGGSTIPAICGTMTGEHLYVDADMSCNMVGFQLASMPSSPAALAARNWNIRITQIPCNDNNLPPQGCQQWFFNNNAGTVRSYNFQGNHHLANQRQVSCIRRERGTCRICYATMAGDFVVSSMVAGKVFVTKSSCCGYGIDGMKTNGYDCVIIPGAVNLMNVPVSPQICGQTLGTMDNMAAAATVCTRVEPFKIIFHSDGFEFAEGMGEVLAKVNNKGFQIAYKLDLNMC